MPWVSGDEVTAETDALPEELAHGEVARIPTILGVGVGNVLPGAMRKKHAASYLEFAMRKGMPIATLDKELTAASRKGGGAQVAVTL